MIIIDYVTTVVGSKMEEKGYHGFVQMPQIYLTQMLEYYPLYELPFDFVTSSTTATTAISTATTNTTYVTFTRNSC